MDYQPKPPKPYESKAERSRRGAVSMLKGYFEIKAPESLGVFVRKLVDRYGIYPNEVGFNAET